MIRIVADDKIPFLPGALDDLVRIDYLPGADISRAELKDADALITRTRTRCNRDLLEGTGIRFIATATIGYDHIDTEWCRKQGIAWTNAPGCNSSSVEQYLVSTLLWLSQERRLDLKGSVLGVIGVGHVGKKVAAKAEALGMKVLLNDPPRERAEGSSAFVPLEQIQADADVISLHVPLNREGRDKTFHLVNRDFLSGMKKGAMLINSSRGGVVEEDALLEALRKDLLSAAVLDVFEKEPQLSADLLEALALATPHIAGYSLDGKAGGTTQSVRAVSRFFQLGRDRWLPSGIPAPDQAEILADASEQEGYSLLWDIYRQSYDVSMDDFRLRANPDQFEYLRGAYPFRREAGAYAVRLFQGYPEIRSILEKLGFDVLADSCM